MDRATGSFLGAALSVAICPRLVFPIALGLSAISALIILTGRRMAERPDEAGD